MSVFRKMLMNVFHLWRKFTANESEPITIQTMTLSITQKKHQLVYQDMLIKPYILKARVIFSGSLILGIQSWAQMTFNDRRRGKRASTCVICNSITLLFPTCFSHSRRSSPILTRNPREVHAKGWTHVGHIEHQSSTARWTDWWRWLVVDQCGRHQGDSLGRGKAAYMCTVRWNNNNNNNNNKAWKSGHSLNRWPRKIKLQKLFLFVLKVTSQNLYARWVFAYMLWVKKTNTIPMPNFSFANITRLYICTAPFSDNIHGRTCLLSFFCTSNDKWDHTKHTETFMLFQQNQRQVWQVSIQHSFP